MDRVDLDSSLMIPLSNMPLTIFIVIRRDLSKTLGWTAGPIIAQGIIQLKALTRLFPSLSSIVKLTHSLFLCQLNAACHATSAVCHEHASHPNMQTYFKDLSSLHKITLKTKNEASFQLICSEFRQRGLKFHEWVEMPEGLSTALATIPYRKHELDDILKKCQLYK